MKKKFLLTSIVLCLLLIACTGNSADKSKVGVVLDANGVDDRSFNEYTWKGAELGATENGLDATYIEASSAINYDASIETFINSDTGLIITVGFNMADATAQAARANPDHHFIIVDHAYYPGSGCAETVDDCYTEEGGLANVTSLLFAEDEVGYLAGVLAGCMTESNVIASVAGMEIPPVVRFVTGYQNGAKSVNPDITTLNRYIPSFEDSDLGFEVANNFISRDADVVFGVGGKTGNGALLAMHDADLMAIGVDVDQYYSYPEVKEALLTSASKKLDVATANLVNNFAGGHLDAGIQLATIANGGVGLAPFHDWEDKIPNRCKILVDEAYGAVRDNPDVTGVK